VFVGVVALGIIGLDAAATLDRHGWRRAAYLSGMVLFLLMETLANYFAAQATFVGKVVEKMKDTPGSDLARIVLHEPFWSRMLVVLFLSLASLAVAAFTFAAANRVGQIRASVAKSESERAKMRRMLARRREWFASIRAKLDEAREQRATTDHDTAQLREIIAKLEETAAMGREANTIHEETNAGLLEQNATLMEQVASLRQHLASQAKNMEELRERSEYLRDQDENLREAREQGSEQTRIAMKLRAENDQLRAELEQRPANMPPTRANVVAYARERMRAGASLNETARELGWTESTLRGWLASVAEEVA
jgi:hypothetical protein